MSFDAIACAICIVLLVAWLQDHRRDRARRKRWEIRAGQSLDKELETRRRALDDLNQRD